MSMQFHFSTKQRIKNIRFSGLFILLTKLQSFESKVYQNARNRGKIKKLGQLRNPRDSAKFQNKSDKQVGIERCMIYIQGSEIF